MSKLKGRPRISFREWAVVFFGAGTMAFTAWGLAGVVTWCLHIMLIGGCVTLALSVLPMPALLNGEDGEHGNLQNIKRLLAFPGFWFGAAFLIYLTIQGFNPAAEVVRDERGWWVEAVKTPLGTQLPTSVSSDYEPMNAFRVLVSFSAAFTLSWGLWVGVRRRLSAVLILWVFILSGSGMGLVAILQHLSETKEVLWSVPSSNPEFWGSFFYRNQSVAYLNLILIATGCLYFYHSRKAKLHGNTGGPHLLLFCLFGLVVASIALALSRGGILFCALLSLVFICFAILQWFAGLSDGHSMRITLLVGGALVVGVFSIVRYIDIDAISSRFGDVERTIEYADQNPRALSTRATLDMAKERWVYGWGAGSFRYIFPMYQRNYPKIYYQTYSEHRGGWWGRRVYRYAHNDIVQFFAEYGAVGCGILLMMFGAFFVSALRWGLENVFSLMFLLLGCGVLFTHALFDFIFNSPAFWCAFVSFQAMGAKILTLDAHRR